VLDGVILFAHGALLWGETAVRDRR
jgi:hypothetical protein